MTSRLLLGDCRLVLQLVGDESVDAVITDPPAGIEFMNAEWDSFTEREATDSGRQTDTWGQVFGVERGPYGTVLPRFQGKQRASLLPFQDFIAEVFAEVYRVLKPGAHALVWAIPRTSHHTAMGIERAGFEIRDVITHHFGTGFPKSRDVAKDFDPSTEAAQQWSGWGTALKPASEHWILARKPLVGTVAGNLAAFGTGALNIDDCRIATADALGGGAEKEVQSDKPDGWDRPWRHDPEAQAAHAERIRTNVARAEDLGRWPANLVLSHSPGCELVGTTKIKAIAGTSAGRMAGKNGLVYGGYTGRSDRAGEPTGFGDADGYEAVEVWECADDCPVAELDRQSGFLTSGKPGFHRLGVNTSAAYGTESRGPGTPMSGYGDQGGASRFFYVAKPSRNERNAGLEVDESGEVPNSHPTVKSVSLMRWLVKLITPPGGTVLDCFVGSGTTGIACIREGFDFVGIEKHLPYYAMAEARMAWAVDHPEYEQYSLFGDGT